MIVCVIDIAMASVVACNRRRDDDDVGMIRMNVNRDVDNGSNVDNSLMRSVDNVDVDVVIWK